MLQATGFCFQVLCFIWRFSYIRWQSTSIWPSCGVLQPRKRFVCVGRKTFFLFYRLIFAVKKGQHIMPESITLIGPSQKDVWEGVCLLVIAVMKWSPDRSVKLAATFLAPISSRVKMGSLNWWTENLSKVLIHRWQPDWKFEVSTILVLLMSCGVLGHSLRLAADCTLFLPLHHQTFYLSQNWSN